MLLEVIDIMALEGIRVIGPSGGRERRKRRRRQDEGDKRPFDDALKKRLESPETEESTGTETSEDETEKPGHLQAGSRWWRSQKEIDFVV